METFVIYLAMVGTEAVVWSAWDDVVPSVVDVNLAPEVIDLEVDEYLSEDSPLNRFFTSCRNLDPAPKYRKKLMQLFVMYRSLQNIVIV